MKFKILDTLVLLFILMFFSLLLTWILPSGEFDSEVNENGIEVVIPGSYEVLAKKEYLSKLVLYSQSYSPS